jgi:hypothetical protein
VLRSLRDTGRDRLGRNADHAAAMRRLRGERIRIVSTEMVLFEWLHRADIPEFRELLPLIR